ncbi:uncharacterized protein [Fopius arisanus]|uniref:Uncharacterized protein n=1 Tax=Fopius arisanus TaxID=64838 RepID=A0A9R1T4F0_9HYME|nr:PREDICTED: uncharacterized protein LOC105266242 [Fopius arisanus]
MTEKIENITLKSLKNLSNANKELTLSAREESVNESKIQDVTDLSYEDLKISLSRAKEEAVEPFTFLNNISDELQASYVVPRDTDIDIQLAALSQRIELNKSLLEKTNARIKRINSSEDFFGVDEMTDIPALPPGPNSVSETLRASLSTIAQVQEIISKTSEALY